FIQLIYLRYLHGIDEYSGPSNLFVEKKYDNSVRLKWTLTSTCYERTKITLSAKSENGEKFSRIIDEDADHFDLTGLEPGTTYNLSFITEYGEQKSNPVFLVFRTSLTKTSAALTAGGIAGISIAMILIPGIIIGGMIAWKKWKSCFRYKEQTYEKKMADEDSLSVR
ncbi:uncharacterized protein LOC134254586, partial [Saccostrea cucullata]|uniref:uncharacterized protein LOC134254586 n=1 Tax=Saccostrea cuccullata TaxID=36930 RepID=UPI002ED64B04